MSYYVSHELYHHGVLGQKWGVRRYQNADGSLTAAGKAKLDKYKSKNLDKAERRYASEKETAQNKYQLAEIEERRQKEISAIKNAKLSDIREENRAGRKAVADMAGVSLACLGTLAATEAAALSAGFIFTGALPVAAAVASMVGLAMSPAAGSAAKIQNRIERANRK